VHQLVGESLRQGLQHLLRVVAAGEQPERALHFMPARILRLVAQRADERHRLAQLHPVHELPDLGVDDRLGLLHRRASRVEVAHDALQVVSVEERRQFARLLDVAQHRSQCEHRRRRRNARSTSPLPRSAASSRCRTPRCRARAAGRQLRNRSPR
jgi:hypothetical protein